MPKPQTLSSKRKPIPCPLIHATKQITSSKPLISEVRMPTNRTPTGTEVSLGRSGISSSIRSIG